MPLMPKRVKFRKSARGKIRGNAQRGNTVTHGDFGLQAVEGGWLSAEQVALTIKDTVKHLFQLRFQSAAERLETPSEIKKARRDIARLQTIQREKQLAAQKKTAEGAKANG